METIFWSGIFAAIVIALIYRWIKSRKTSGGGGGRGGDGDQFPR